MVSDDGTRIESEGCTWGLVEVDALLYDVWGT